MSHPQYNPYASGNQRSNQGQYRTSSIQPDRDLRRDIPGYGPGSSFSPPPASSATPANHGGNIPSLLDLPVIHRPEQGRARVSKAIERSVELHVSRAREEVGCLDRPAQPIDQSTRFTHTQSDDILSSGPGTTSYPMSSTSASVGRRHAEGESGSSSLDWLPKYKRSTADDSTKSYSLPASSSYTSSADVGRFKTSSDRERDIPGLGDYVYPAPDKPAAPTETGPHKHTSESAADILLNFGLEKEDLEFLISYPEEQITPDNLPFLLRQIRSHKANRAMTAVESKPFPQPQPSRVVSERDILSSSGGSSAVLQPNKVIEYGHTSKYVGGVLDDIGRTSGRGASSGGSDISLFLNEQRSSSDSREQLETEMRRIPAVLTRVESSSVPPDRSSYTSVLRSAAPVSRDPVQQFQTQPDQTSKPIFNPFSIPKKDAGRKVFTSEAWKPSPLKAPETKPQLTLKSQQSSNVLDNVYPGRRGLVVIDKIYSGAAKDESATRGQDPGFSEAPKQQPQMQHLQKQQEQLAQMKHVQKQQEQLAEMQHVQKQQEQLAQMKHVQKQQEQLAQMQHVQKQQEQLAQMQHVQKQHEQLAQMQHVQKQQKKQKQPAQKQTAQKQPAQKQSAQKQTAQKQPTQKQPAQTMNAQTQQLQKQPVSQLGLPTVYPTVKPYYFPPNVYPPGSLQPSPNSWSRADQRLVQVPGPQNQPSEAVMFDYAATTPTVFPHTCSLCYKKCFHMKDWISHQNSTLHLNSCKYVRTLYPQWTGEIVPEPSDAGANATPSTSASGRTSQRRDEKTSAGRRSRSPSPRRRHRPDSSREKRSLSRSSRGSSYGRSRSRSHDRSRSRSYERSRKRERRSSSRRRGDKRSSPRRSKERRSSPRRSRERRSSPRKRSEERRSSTRRRDDRRSSPRRRDERRSSVRRSRERRSSSESSSERRSSSADRLVKKVLEKSDVKSLSKPSDVEAVVKTLFAEIAKLKSSSSSSSTKRGKTSKSTPSAGRKSSTSAASSSSSASKAKKTPARDEDAKQKTTPQQVVTKDQTVAEGSTKETGAKVSVSEATKVSTQQVSKKSRSEPTNVSEVTVKVETASSSQEPKSPVDNLAETKGRDTKDAKSKLKPQAEGVRAEANQAAGAEPMELGETGGDVAESLEVESCAEGKETNVEAFSDKSSESQSPTSKDETGTPTVQTADEESSQESTERAAASGLGTKMEDSRPPSPTEEGEGNTKDPESAEENQRDPTSAAGTGSEKPAAAASFSSALTIGEKVEEHFHPNKIKCLSKGSAMSQECCTTLLISNLPKFHEGCYTEDDVAGVFVPFGLESWSEEIYVVPQARVAFVVMPSALSVRKVLSASPDVFALKENRLLLQVLERKDMQPLNDPFRFYTALMKWMDTPTDGDGHRTVFIRNISPSEAGDLREALRKMGSISNYLPLLNKVFIEFESGLEADRLGIWCSLLKQAPSYTVVRLKAPFSARTAHTPKQPVKAIPHSKDAAAWATTPSQNYGVPRGSCSPFWITMSTSPFVFPTMCPWFAIPKYQTVRGYADIKKLNSRGTMFPTLMLTGFPEGGYRQEDIVRLVRPYYPKHFRHSLYYNVIVLTLQRRAFVHFSDWTSCCEFVKDSIREPFIVRGCVLMVHFLLEDMCPESKEELMYKSMMKWSNSRVPDPESLEERLLCVEISQTSVYLIKTVMKTVASIAKFVSFLPLANRICVEMADSSGAAQVLKKYRVFTPSAQCERLMLKKVIGFRSLKSLEKHIESSSGASTEARPPKQTSISASAEPAGDVPMEDVEKLGAEMTTESTSVPKANEDVDAADGDTVPAASSATSLPKSNETTTEHPPIDQDAVTAVLAAVRQHRLALERTQRGETESSLRSQNQDEVTDVVTSDDQPLYLSDFVTVDEVGDDVEETNPAHEASRGRGDAKKRKRDEESAESCKDVEEADDQIPKDEDQPRKVCSNKHSKATEQKDSEILITTESESDNKKPDATSRRDDRSSKRSGLRTRASKSEEKVKSPEKQDRLVKRSETPRDSSARLPQRDQDPEEEKASEMLHSTEELVQEAAATERTDRRRSGRGKKEDKMTLNLTEASEKPDEGEEASYEILDSVEDETVTEEPVVMTRSTRGRRGRTTQKDQTKKEDTPTRGRRTPAKESQEKTPKMEKEATSMENSPAKKTDITVREEIDEDATYEILDSVEDEVLQDDRPPTGGKRKRGRRKRAVKSTRKKPVTLKGDKDASEKEAGDEEKVSCQIVDSVEDEMVEDQPPTEESLKDKEEEPVHQIVDSVEDEMVEDQPPTEESLKEKEEEPVHQIVDSVEDEMVEDQPPTEESLKDKEEDPVHQIVDSVEDEMVEDQPPTEESLKNEEEEPVHQIVDSVKDEMVEDQPPTEESLKDKEEEPVHQIVDSVEDEMVEDQPPTEESLKDKEEELVHQIVDSVEDEMVEDQPPTEESLKNEEEEPVHQIVDSVEDDQAQEELMTTEESKDETCPNEEEAAVQEDAPTCSTIVLEASEKVVAEDLESGNDPSAAEESGVDEKERSLKTDIKEEDTSTTKSQGDAATPAEEKNQQSSGESDTTAVQSALLNLDEVRGEEDDYPEDTAEAEGLRERQAAAKEQERETREEDGKEPRSRSAKETGKEQEVVDSTELVTLDEVGADEAGEETVAQGQELDGEIRAGELQGLVPLEEIVDAEEGEVEQNTLDHAMETLDEVGDDEEAEKTTSPVKRRINDDTEESATCVTVDEVEEEGKKEAPRTRGRPKKRTRKKPVRKSTRGMKVVEQAESSSEAPPPTSLEASFSSDKDPSTLSSDSQQEIQKVSLEGAGHSSIDAASAGPDLQPEPPENQRLEGEKAIEASSLPSKRKREPVGPEAKRSRSLSPSVSTDIKLPPFSPSNPLGPEFLVPKLGYFCNLCHVFCVHESSARDTHCSSQTHYDNLQKHYEKLQPEPSKGSTGNSQASFSD